MVMQRIFSRPSGRKCLSCDWPIEGRLRNDTQYTCGRCGQVHLVSTDHKGERIVITRKECAWMHKAFTLSVTDRLKKEKALLKLELKARDRQIEELNQKLERITEKVEKALEG